MSIFYPHEEQQLYHHGILGMKWGIRRYQPYPNGQSGGKFVGERSAKKTQGFKDAKRTRGDMTRVASAIGLVSASANKKADKAERKAARNSSEKNVAKAKEARAEANKWQKEYSDRENLLKSHVNKMQKQYGKENVKDVSYQSLKSGKGKKQRVVDNGRANRILARISQVGSGAVSGVASGLLARQAGLGRLASAGVGVAGGLAGYGVQKGANAATRGVERFITKNVVKGTRKRGGDDAQLNKNLKATRTVLGGYGVGGVYGAGAGAVANAIDDARRNKQKKRNS